jgi:RNA polymerase primary sigma factor
MEAIILTIGLEAIAMKRKRSADSETEAVTLEPLPSRSLFGEIPEQIRLSRSDYNKDEIDEPVEDFELEGEELVSEEEGEIEREQFLQEKAPFYPEDITWKYLKGLEKVSLLTPTQEVALAKKIKQGEHQIKLLKTRTSHLKTRAKKSLNKSKPSPTETKERTLLYEKALEEYQQAILETQEAKNELIQANLRLVISIAKRYANRGTPFLDLIQEGNIGLMQALVRFDYRKGYKFSTYASWWIRAAILRAFAEKSRTIRIPNYLFEIKGKFRSSLKSLMKKLGREPSSEELCKDTGIPLQDVEKILNLGAEPISLNMPIGEESSTLGDLIADEQSVSPSDLLLEKDLIYHTRKLLSSLSPREEKILRLRFGIESNGEYTLGEIGRQFGLSRERIRQIEAKAIDRLRDPNKYKEIGEYFE